MAKALKTTFHIALNKPKDHDNKYPIPRKAKKRKSQDFIVSS